MRKVTVLFSNPQEISGKSYRKSWGATHFIRKDLRYLRDLFFVPQISQIHTDSWLGFKVTQIPQMTQMIGDVIHKNSALIEKYGTK